MDGKMNSLIICLYSLKILGALGFNPYLCAQKMNDGMIKRYCFFLFLGMVSLSLWAGPAKRNVWKRLTLSDGSTVMATLCGDENHHYWRSADGTMYVRSTEDTTFVERPDETSVARSKPRRSAAVVASVAKTRAMSAALGRSSLYTGQKKGLIILVNFLDKSFSSSDPAALFGQIANSEGYQEGKFKGSVRDYFLAQSHQRFDLSFDVEGPVTLSHAMSYYGKNNASGTDQFLGAMVAEACQLVDSSVDFSQYDWDGDGYVDQVYVIYAGYSEAEGASDDTIWPSSWSLMGSDYGKTLTLDGVIINNFACSSELTGTSGQQVGGIGTICHEFSHCLGFPDLYDINYKGNFGMGHWDLMDSGEYNGDGYHPAGYSGYEKWMAGWQEPIELSSNTTVSHLKAMSEGGDCYIIYNDGDKDEFYLLENRQNTYWDDSLPGRGLLISHVDYDSLCWYNNVVNATGSFSYSDGYSTDFSNDHQRYTIFHADKDDDSSYWNPRLSTWWKQTEDGDAYPYGSNNSLTNQSLPAATLYRANTDGSYQMNKQVLSITQNGDGTVSFVFVVDTTSTGVRSVETMPSTVSHIYTLSGQDVGTDFEALPKGIYIVGGKKKAKR